MAAPGFRRSAELFGALVERQVRLRAKRSRFGLVWPLIAPVFLLLLYVFVFRRVFHVPVPRYAEFLFAGLLPWSFLTQSLGSALSSLSLESDLIRRSRFPYELLPLAQVAVFGLYFLAGLAGFVAVLAGRGRIDWVALPFVILPVAGLALLVASLAMTVALVDVYNHDLRQILANLLMVWFFLTPIVYSTSMMPGAVRFLRRIDPMGLVVARFRDVLYAGRAPGLGPVVVMLGACGGIFAVALAVFRRSSANLAKDV